MLESAPVATDVVTSPAPTVEPDELEIDAERGALVTKSLGAPVAEESGTVEATIATFNVPDFAGDTVLRSAFIDGTRVRMCWAHDDTAWIGDGTITTDETTAKFAGRFWLSTTSGREAFERVKAAGDLAQWSWTAIVPPGAARSEMQGGKLVNYLGLKALEVLEVSPVLLAAGIGTRTISVKGAPYAAHSADLVGEIETWRTRTREIVDLRAKSGRVLSAANIARLETVRGAAASAVDEIDAVLAAARAPDEEAVAKAAAVERAALERAYLAAVHREARALLA